jgi:hypothetical protein
LLRNSRAGRCFAGDSPQPTLSGEPAQHDSGSFSVGRIPQGGMGNSE